MLISVLHVLPFCTSNPRNPYKIRIYKCCIDNCSKRAYKARKRQEKIQASLELDLNKSNVIQKEIITTPTSLNTKDFLSIKEASQLLA